MEEFEFTDSNRGKEPTIMVRCIKRNGNIVDLKWKDVDWTIRNSSDDIITWAILDAWSL